MDGGTVQQRRTILRFLLHLFLGVLRGQFAWSVAGVCCLRCQADHGVDAGDDSAIRAVQWVLQKSAGLTSVAVLALVHLAHQVQFHQFRA